MGLAIIHDLQVFLGNPYEEGVGNEWERFVPDAPPLPASPCCLSSILFFC
jgi:hypothetical protein